jgi:hypothetical protein
MYNTGQISDKGAYMPSPEEIKKSCEKIQATWGRAEKRKRTVVHSPEASIQKSVVHHRRRNLKENLNV